MTDRIIGIRHRVKATAEGEMQPTEVAIKIGSKVKLISLADEQAELDFLLGVYPISYRAISDKDKLTNFLPHHITWKEVKSEKDIEGVPEKFIRFERKKTFRVSQVPSKYEGLKNGDTVAMVLGGSGDYFAYALANRGKDVEAKVLRLPPFILNKKRDEGIIETKGLKSENKDNDPLLLAELALRQPHLFYEVKKADRELIWVRECFRARTDAMKARIACEQRLRQRTVGQVFCSEDGYFPDGGIEKFFDEKKASDVILKALKAEESSAERALAKATEKLAIYTEVLRKVEGCGVVIASGIISSIIDIRRFQTNTKLKAFMGVHVLPDGRFPRKRTGEVANWKNEARQALYLFGAQLMYRPDSYWGKYQRMMKEKLRAAHPEVIIGENGASRYSNAHINHMATWRTLTRFVEWLYKEWWALERSESSVGQKKAA